VAVDFDLSDPRAPVTIEGLDELIRALQGLGPAATKTSRMAMRRAGGIVLRRAKKRLNAKLRTGRLYNVPGGDGSEVYRASAPGEAPAKLTGDIVKSLKLVVSRSGLSVRVVSTDPKAHFQEYGTLKQKPRPFLRPSLVESKSEVLTEIGKGVTAGIAAVLKRGL
jgi:HK97 gp10 family phage protein